MNVTYPCKCLSTNATLYYETTIKCYGVFLGFFSLRQYFRIAALIVGACMSLYAATHLFYVVVVSGMCSCERCRCTKHNTSTLILGISALCSFINALVYLVSGVFGGITSISIIFLAVHFVCAPLAASMSFVLLATSISDLVFHGEDMVGRRRCITIVCWTLFIVAILCGVVGHVMTTHVVSPSWAYTLGSIFIGFACVAIGVVAVISTVLIVVAHLTMRKVEFASYCTHLIYNYRCNPNCLRR